MKHFFKVILGILAFLALFSIKIPSEAENLPSFELKERDFVIFFENTVLPTSSPQHKEKSFFVLGLVTAYSSTPWETDEDPFITASGEMVRDGIVANNFFPFGTKIKIPQIFGDKIFVVKDRMKRGKWKYHFDIWFENPKEALKFGAKMTEIEILQ